MIRILRHGTRRIDRRAVRATFPFTLLACVTVLGGCSMLENTGSDGDPGNRLYVGAGLLASQLEPDTSGVAGASVDDSMGSGGSLTLGYDLNSRFSVEGHLASLGDATIDPAGTIGYSVGGVSGLYHVISNAHDRPRREGVAVYGRLGLGAMENSASGVTFERINDVHVLAGFGLEYGLGMGVGLRAEFVSHETDAKYGQLGLVYRFGTQEQGDSRAAVSPLTPVAASPEIAVPPAGPEVGNPLFGGVIEGINFQTGSATLTVAAIRVLAGVAETLRAYPDIRIIIGAHTDNQGEAADNLQLSKRRAIAVARYFVNAGISGSRLRAQAYGESRPRAINQTAQGRAANRRVEFSILQ